MPELAEVEYFRKQWDVGMGKSVLKARVNAKSRVFRGEIPAAIENGLRGAKLLESLAHGKNLLFKFSRKLWLGGHLGMTGELLVKEPDFTPAKHDHLVLFQKSHALVFRDPRMFGRIRLHEGAQQPDWWQKLPPHISSKEFTAEWVADFLKGSSRAPLKALLMEQDGFPGIGNWMADEILWRLKWHPGRTAKSLEKRDLKALHKEAKWVSRRAVEIIGTTWDDPPESWLFPHRWRTGGRCPRCKSPLERGELRGRTACWCPKCQKSK